MTESPTWTERPADQSMDADNPFWTAEYRGHNLEVARVYDSTTPYVWFIGTPAPRPQDGLTNYLTEGHAGSLESAQSRAVNYVDRRIRNALVAVLS